MRLTDLLDAEVVDRSGLTIGRVHDVRLVQDGPPVGAAGASFRIEGLVVGGMSFGARLGYSRANVRGPWVLRRLFRRLRADDRLVPWPAVRAITDGSVLISVAADELVPPPVLP
jgi:sporulation protein YlmC with PRC-barrel domain